MAIVVVVCGKICGKIDFFLDQNKIWCDTRYGPHDYDSGNKKAKIQKGKKAKRQKVKKTKRQKGKKDNKDNKKTTKKDKKYKNNNKKIQK